MKYIFIYLIKLIIITNYIHLTSSKKIKKPKYDSPNEKIILN